MAWQGFPPAYLVCKWNNDNDRAMSVDCVSGNRDDGTRTSLSYAANLRKQISSLLDQWLDENTAANLARWLIRQREVSVLGPEQPPAAETATGSSESVPDNLLPDRTVPHNGR